MSSGGSSSKTPRPDGGSGTHVWFIEGYIDDNRTLRRIPIDALPFRVGRKSHLNLSLNLANISRVHAEIYTVGRMLYLRDLDSRNGTYVNHERIVESIALRSGDVIHFGTSEFRLGFESLHRTEEFSETMEFKGSLPAAFATGTQEFMEMLRSESVCPVFQPIVRLADGSHFGFELLGRGDFLGLTELPKELFNIAAAVGMEAELSRLFRMKGAVTAAQSLGESPRVFVNIHPVEMRDPEALLTSLDALKNFAPGVRFTLEIHEGLVTDIEAMRDLRAGLATLDFQLAYDDFGAGQARLVELADVPPDYLKFDMSLIQDIHQKAPQRQQMVRVLIELARDMGVKTVAEGIERLEEATACRDLAFDFAQGYFFGRPTRAEATSAIAGHETTLGPHESQH